MTPFQKTISFALILSFMFVTLGVAVEQAPEQMEENPLLAEIRALKERIACLENALAQAVAKLEQIPRPPRNTSNSGIDADPEKHRLEVEQHLAHQEIDVDAQKRRLELEQDLAREQAEHQRNIVTFSTEQEAEANKFRLEMEQSVQERKFEMKREIEEARIEHEQAVQEREIERNLAIETMQIDQHRQVQEADIEKNTIIEQARIAQEREVEKAHIEKYMAIELAKIKAELEREKGGVEVEKEMKNLKEELTAVETEHRKKMATLTRLVVLPLKYVKAGEITYVVKPFLSEHAIIAVNDKENALVIRDVEDCVKDAEMIIEKLDVLREKRGRETNDD